MKDGENGEKHGKGCRDSGEKKKKHAKKRESVRPLVFMENRNAKKRNTRRKDDRGWTWENTCEGRVMPWVCEQSAASPSG